MNDKNLCPTGSQGLRGQPYPTLDAALFTSSPLEADMGQSRRRHTLVPVRVILAAVPMPHGKLRRGQADVDLEVTYPSQWTESKALRTSGHSAQAESGDPHLGGRHKTKYRCN